MKKFTSIIVALLMALNLTFVTAFAADEYVLGFNTQEETEGINASVNSSTALDFDEKCGALVARPNFSKTFSVNIPVDSARISDKNYVKVRYLFMDTFGSDAKMVLELGNIKITLDNLNGKQYGKWYEAVAELPGVVADKAVLYPAYATDDMWTTTGNVCIDYLGFFQTKSAAESYSELDDSEYYPSYSPEEEGNKISVSKDAKFIKGYTNARSFKPEANISRAEAATMISRIMSSSAKSNGALPFEDVAAESWYAEDVANLLASGVISKDTAFRPDDAITRGEFVSMVYRLGTLDSLKTAYFNDVSKTAYYYKPVAAAAGNDIVNGYSDGTFKPENAITRAEAVVILNRVTGTAQSNALPEGQLYDDVAPAYWAYRDIMLASSGATVSEGEGESDIKLLNGIFDQYNEKGNVWEPVPLVSEAQKAAGLMGGEGGQIQVDIAIDSTGEFLIACADVGNTMRSLDGGKTWQECARGTLNVGLNWTAIDPNNSSRVVGVTRYGNDDTLVRKYGATYYGLYLSEDYAEHFDQVLTYGDPGMHRGREFIAWDPTSFDAKINGSAVVYYSPLNDPLPSNFRQASEYEQEKGYNEGPGLYRSDDGGHTWKMVNPDMAAASIKVSYDDGTVYAVKDGALYRSTNKGESFTLVQNGVLYLDVVQTQPKNVYAISNSGVYVSTDNGQSFTKQGVAPPIETSGICDFKVSPANTDYMAYGRLGATTVQYNIMYTHDGGTTWQQSSYDESSNIFHQEPRNKMLAWHPTDQNKLWTTADWVESSDDGGANIKWDFNGGIGTCINCWWRPSTQNPDLWLIPIQDFSGVVSLDGGNTFKWIRDFGTSSHNYGGCIVDENTMFVARTGSWEATRLDLLGTHDGGKTWETYGEIPYGFTNCRFFQSPTDPNVIFAGNYRSADGGYTWEVMEGVKCASTYSPGSKMLFGFGTKSDEIMRSVDNGETWHVYTKGETIEGWEWPGIQYGLDYDYVNDILYYEKYGTIYKVTKDGKTTCLRDNINASGAEFWGTSIAVDPIHPEVIYYTGWGTRASYYSKYEVDNTILRSCDGGETWQIISTVSNDGKSIVKDGGWVTGRSVRGGFVDPQTGYYYVHCANLGLMKIAPPYELDK